MTQRGKELVYNITAISEISSEAGLYKIFSSNTLPGAAVVTLFGENAVVEYEKVWGGKHGGATPDFRGTGLSTEFLLFDGATGFHGHTSSGALYYASAVETALSCVETSAMGALAVAKLVAKRLGWISVSQHSFRAGDEL